MRTLSALLAVIGRFFAVAMNPRLGGLAKPFAATYHSLGRMLVEVFGALRLIERSHPWRRPGAPVRLSAVLALAWARTNWRKPWEPVPVFVASTSALLVLGFLTLGTALVAGGVGATKAYAGSLFTSPSPSTDLALNYMRDAFGVKITGTTATTADIIVQGFQQMMGLYSMAMLVVAGFILLYIILTAVAATAHEGRFGGSGFNQVWAPIRLVVAIGLLVPLPMGSYAGYNSGQYIVLVLAQWGSALASNLWVPFATSLSQRGGILAEPNVEPAASVVRGVLLAEFCLQRYNRLRPSGEPMMKRNPDSIGITKYVYYDPSNATKNGYCGITSYEYPKSSGVSAFVKNVLVSYEAAYLKMQSSAASLARTLDQETYIDDGALPGEGTDEAVNRALLLGDNSFIQIVTTYQNDLAKAVASANQYHNTKAAEAMSKEVKDAGWAGASMWFNTIARINAEFMYAVRSLPNTLPPALDTASANAREQPVRLLAEEVKEGVRVLNDYMEGLPGKIEEYTGNGLIGYAQANTAQVGTSSVFAGFNGYGSGSKPSSESEKTWTSFQKHASSDIGRVLSEVFDTKTGGPFQSTGTGINMKLDEVYPLADLAAIGDWMVNRSFVLLMSAGLLAQNLFTMLGIAGAGTGLVLLYVLPLMPFIRFLFGVVGWLLNILEAIIAIPLVAVAHLTTGGSGLSGDLARDAYFMIFSIFLRPALLIVGMIVSLLMFSVAVHVLNTMYQYAVVGAAGASTGGESNGGLSVIMYTVLYTVIAYMLCNLCFTMIETIPNKAMTWIRQAAAREITQDESVKSAISNAGDHIVFTPMRTAISRK